VVAVSFALLDLGYRGELLRLRLGLHPSSPGCQCHRDRRRSLFPDRGESELLDEKILPPLDSKILRSSGWVFFVWSVVKSPFYQNPSNPEKGLPTNFEVILISTSARS